MPYEVVRRFEEELAAYAGSPLAVTVDCCTNAIFLCCRYLGVGDVTLPSRTYVSVPAAVLNAGGRVAFEDVEWTGGYQLKPYPIYDSALRLRRGMYTRGDFVCLSFSATKAVNVGRGGAILCDSPEAAAWFRLARYMGRHEVPHRDDRYEMVGWNMYMTPEQAARGLQILSRLKEQDVIQESGHPSDYQDLSRYEFFTGRSAAAPGPR